MNTRTKKKLKIAAALWVAYSVLTEKYRADRREILDVLELHQKALEILVEGADSLTQEMLVRRLKLYDKKHLQ